MATVLTAAAAVVFLTVAVFILLHVRQLTPTEVAQLAAKRRTRKIGEYFSFVSGEGEVNGDFKKRLKPNGAFYRLNESLSEWPRLAAALLKYKKHEWIVVAFECSCRITLVWVNKGSDKSSVNLMLPIPAVIDVVARDACTSVMVLHNHPNSNPSRLNCTAPSDTDIRTAECWSRQLLAAGVNLIEFVCERGHHYQYFARYADSFMPQQVFHEQVEQEHGHSWYGNLDLHCERLFS